jgi:hypothetical protein
VQCALNKDLVQDGIRSRGLAVMTQSVELTVYIPTLRHGESPNGVSACTSRVVFSCVASRSFLEPRAAEYRFLCLNSRQCLDCMEPGKLSRYSDWLRAGRQMGRSSSPGRVKNFLSSTSSKPALGPTQHPIQWVPGVLSPGLKRPGREADHSPPTSAEVKNTWIYTSTSPYAFMA